MAESSPSTSATPAPPGTGPAGEVCGSCDSFWSATGVATKCVLAASSWTMTPETDVGRNTPACSRWSPMSPVPDLPLSGDATCATCSHYVAGQKVCSFVYRVHKEYTPELPYGGKSRACRLYSAR